MHFWTCAFRWNYRYVRTSIHVWKWFTIFLLDTFQTHAFMSSLAFHYYQCPQKTSALFFICTFISHCHFWTFNTFSQLISVTLLTHSSHSWRKSSLLTRIILIVFSLIFNSARSSWAICYIDAYFFWLNKSNKKSNSLLRFPFKMVHRLNCHWTNFVWCLFSFLKQWH